MLASISSGDIHPVFLIGFMGAGKTTVAQALASKFDVAWVDIDALVEQAANCSITEIFATQGELAFRNLETKALTQAIQERAHIVACGGGIVQRAENVDAMRKAGCIVYLQVDVEHALARIPDTSSRPLLANPNQAAKLLDARIPLYEQAADITIDTADQSPDQVAEEIISKLIRIGIE